MTSATMIRANGAPAAIALDTSQTCKAAKTRSAAAAWKVIRRPRLRAAGPLGVERPIRRGPNVDALVQPPRLATPRHPGFQPHTPASSQIAPDSLIFRLKTSEEPRAGTATF